MGRIVREICQDCHERHSGQRFPEAFEERAIEVRYERYHHVGPVFPPEPGQQLELRSVVQANHRMHAGQQISGSQRPAFGECQVINILQSNACGFTENVEGVKNLLQVYQADLPIVAFPRDHGL